MDYQIVKDFELEQNESGWTITKYVGFDVENMEIPSEIDGKKITAIGKSLFSKNKILKTIKMQSGIERIEESAFEQCDNLTSVELPNTLKEIGDNAFYYCKIQDIVFPNTLEQIGNTAFSWNFELKKVILPDSVTKIGEEAFSDCRGIYDVVLSQNLKTIPKSAFMACKKLTHIHFPDNLENIEEKAFSASHIKTLQIPATIKKIGKHAFEQCCLESVFVLPGSKVILGEGAFLYNYDLCEIYIPASITDMEDIFYCQGSLPRIVNGYAKDAFGQTIIDNAGNRIRTLDYEGGVSPGTHLPSNLTAYCEANSTFIKYAKDKGIKCAEYNASAVLKKSEEMKYALTDIFCEEHLCTKSKPQDKDEKGYEYVISKNVKTIKSKAICGSGIYLFEDNSQLEKIESYAFYGAFESYCYSLHGQAFVLPPSVKIIEKSAFYHCDSLRKIKIPSTCKVEDGAFEKQYSWNAPTKIIYYNPSQDGDNSGNNSGIMGKLKSLFKK